MKRKKEFLSYFFLIIFLFFLLNMPKNLAWKMGRIFVFPVELFAKNSLGESEIELMQLRIENAALKEQIDYIRTYLTSEERIENYMNRVDVLTPLSTYSPFLKRRIEELNRILSQEIYSIEGRVVYRDPAFWGSGLWIDKGEIDNKKFGRKIIAKNSPVLVGSSVVGIVETVEEERSYVRLITDASLTPAVRAVRGYEQNFHLMEKVTALEELLELRSDLHSQENLKVQLQELKEVLKNETTTSYLAKGELRGSSYPLWRSRSNTLKGIGFNYEYADREGAGKQIHQARVEAILKVGDLIVTSGLDGIFPAGLYVATVSKISPLKEGGFAYDIEAKSTAGNLDEISVVSICPPLQ